MPISETYNLDVMEYLKDGEARFKKHVANKTTLFSPEQMYNFEQTKLF